MSVRAQAEAFLTLLRTSNATVYDVDSVPDNPPYPYIVDWPDLGRPDAPRLSGHRDMRVWRHVLHFVGSSAAEARWAAEQAAAVLEDARPVAAGYRCGQVHMESSTPVGRDNDGEATPTGIFMGTATYTYTSIALEAA